QGPSESLSCRLCHVVRSPVSATKIHRGAGNHHDISSWTHAHFGDHELTKIEGTVRVDAHQMVELFSFRLNDGTAFARYARVVDEDVHWPQFSAHSLHHCTRVLLTLDAGLIHLRPDTSCSEQIQSSPGLTLGATEADRDIGSVVGQCHRHGSPDAPASSGH